MKITQNFIKEISENLTSLQKATAEQWVYRPL